jgi:hypothetical protein
MTLCYLNDASDTIFLPPYGITIYGCQPFKLISLECLEVGVFLNLKRDIVLVLV